MRTFTFDQLTERPCAARCIERILWVWFPALGQCEAQATYYYNLPDKDAWIELDV
jgi:hypothetical protein